MSHGKRNPASGAIPLTDWANLPAELRIALSYTAAPLRPRLAAALLLDQRIGRLVGQSSEPMLGQMKIAWWRDMLGKPVADRPRGDMVLDALGQQWGGQETVLVALVNGWEQLLVEPPLTKSAALAFAEGRAGVFVALAPVVSDAIARAGRIWALTDAAVHLRDPVEQALLAELAKQIEPTGGLPVGLRGLTVLRALSLRSLRHGLVPLMAGRGASLTAFRAGLLGR